MRYGLLFLVLIFLTASSFAPPAKYSCRSGHLHVESYSRYLDIIADNYQMYSEVNPSTGEVLFSGLLKGFKFEMGALDQAFNSNRVDVTKYNKFDFKGAIANNKAINYDKPGKYPVTVKGTLYMGGLSRVTEAKGEVTVLETGELEATANFVITIEDETIKTINNLMREKLPSILAIDAKRLGIAKDIKLRLKAKYRAKSS